LAELRDLKLAFVGQKDKFDEEGVCPKWEGQGQGQNSNMYDRMKANPQAREDSSLLKSPFIVYYRKRRRKSSDHRWMFS